jgi:hypothetical protein
LQFSRALVLANVLQELYPLENNWKYFEEFLSILYKFNAKCLHKIKLTVDAENETFPFLQCAKYLVDANFLYQKCLMNCAWCMRNVPLELILNAESAFCQHYSRMVLIS